MEGRVTVSWEQPRRTNRVAANDPRPSHFARNSPIRRHAKTRPKRELSLQHSIDESSILLSQFAASNTNTPSVNADNREQQMIIAEVLEGLPDDYRQVIMMRNLQGLSHAEIATEMDRSERAIRMLWLRALKQLRHEVLERQ